MGTAAEYPVCTIGHCAYKILRDERQAKILGITSQGIFLHTISNKVLFLTHARYCGPLTINLADQNGFAGNLKISESVQLVFPRLVFSTFSVFFSENVHIWEPTPFRFHEEEIPAAMNRAQKLAAGLIDENQCTLFFDFLRMMVAENASFSEKRKLTKKRLSSSDFTGAQSKEGDRNDFLQGLLGRGAGLTPAGDDFICGYLLACFYLCGCPAEIVQGVLAKARSKTTSLSANLIECAAQGTADERLLKALRYIAEGGVCQAEIREELLSYGSSSGVDNLAGMLASLYLNKD